MQNIWFMDNGQNRRTMVFRYLPITFIDANGYPFHIVVKTLCSSLQQNCVQYRLSRREAFLQRSHKCPGVLDPVSGQPPPDHHQHSKTHSLLFILPAWPPSTKQDKLSSLHSSRLHWHWLQRDICYNQAKSLNHRTLLAVNGHFVVSVCPARLPMVRCTHIVSINIRFRIALTTTNFPCHFALVHIVTFSSFTIWSMQSVHLVTPLHLQMHNEIYTWTCVRYLLLCERNGLVSFCFGCFLTDHVLRPLWRTVLPFCLPKPVDPWCRDDQTVPQYDPSSLAYRHQCQCLSATPDASCILSYWDRAWYVWILQW